MNVTLSANAFLPEELYGMFRTTMEPYVNTARGTPWNEHRERTQFLEQLDQHSVQLIRVDGEIVGFVDLRTESDVRNLHTMIVVTEWQSKGIGSRVIDHLTATSKQITLSVLKSNPRARAFYERKGFREVSSSQHHCHMAWSPNSTVERDARKSGARPSP